MVESVVIAQYHNFINILPSYSLMVFPSPSSVKKYFDGKVTKYSHGSVSFYSQVRSVGFFFTGS